VTGRRHERSLLGFWFPYDIRGWYHAAESLFGEALEAFDIDSSDEATQIVRAIAAAAQAKFMSVLGDSDSGIAQARLAAETLAPLPDRWAYLRAMEGLCECLTNGGQVEELSTVTNQAIRVAEAGGEDWWAIGMLNYRALVELMQGNIESAAAILEDAEEDPSRPPDYVMGPWRLSIRAMIAAAQGQPDDAVELHGRSIELSRRIGNRQALMVGLQGLGEANAAAGRLDAADVAYLENLSMSEEMGLLGEMAGMMIKIAHLRAEMGQKALAVEILACVRADPESSQVLAAMENVPLGAIASERLVELEEDLGSEVFAAAHTRGSAKSIEVGAKELLVN